MAIYLLSQMLFATSDNKDYAVHSFAPLSHSPTFASGTLPAYFTTGKRRIVLDVIRHILMTTFVPINLYPALTFYKL